MVSSEISEIEQGFGLSTMPMEQIPAAMDRHLDVVRCRGDGGLLLGASTLTGRYWLGSLWYYESPEVAPDVEKCTGGVQLEAGLSDAQWVDDTKVLVGLDTGGLAVWELTDNFHTFLHLHSSVEHDDIITCVSIALGSKKAVSASADRFVKIWDLENFSSVNTYKAHADVVHSVKYHPTEPDVFLSSSQDGYIYLWDTRKVKPVCVVDSCLRAPTSLAWHPCDQHTFAVGNEIGEVTIKDTRRDVGVTLSCTPHSRLVYQLEFSKERSNMLASVSEDCTAVVTNVDEKVEEVYTGTQHKDFVRGLSWCGGDQFFTCGWDGLVQSHVVSNITHESKNKSETFNMEVNGEILDSADSQKNMETSANKNDTNNTNDGNVDDT